MYIYASEFLILYEKEKVSFVTFFPAKASKGKKLEDRNIFDLACLLQYVIAFKFILHFVDHKTCET